jgi:hypothetical protein
MCRCAVALVAAAFDRTGRSIRLLTRLNRLTEANPIESFSTRGSPAHAELGRELIKGEATAVS